MGEVYRYAALRARAPLPPLEMTPQRQQPVAGSRMITFERLHQYSFITRSTGAVRKGPTWGISVLLALVHASPDGGRALLVHLQGGMGQTSQGTAAHSFTPSQSRPWCPPFLRRTSARNVTTLFSEISRRARWPQRKKVLSCSFDGTVILTMYFIRIMDAIRPSTEPKGSTSAPFFRPTVDSHSQKMPATQGARCVSVCLSRGWLVALLVAPWAATGSKATYALSLDASSRRCSQE